MDYHDLIYEKNDHIATITLDNPEKLNAMTGQMLASFSRAIERVRRDDDVRVLVLTGAGRGFCTGADTEMLIALAQGKPVPGAVEDESRRHAMELTKQLIYRGLHETNIATQVEREDAALLRGFKTDDYVEGSTAWWIDKRKPVFKGR